MFFNYILSECANIDKGVCLMFFISAMLQYHIARTNLTCVSGSYLISACPGTQP
jgi:hypothetical protein